MSVSRALLCALFVSSTTTLACDAEDEGTLEVRLASTAPSGNVYRLENATLDIIGPEPLSLTPDPAAATAETDLVIGHYAMTLAPGWTMTRSVEGAPFAPVEAELIGNGGFGFTIIAHQTTSRGFRFWVDGGELDFAQGTLETCIEVNETPQWEPGAEFAVGDRVFDEGWVYEARSAHVSTPTRPGALPDIWIQLSPIVDCD